MSFSASKNLRFILFGTVAAVITVILGVSGWWMVADYRATISSAEHQGTGYSRSLSEHAERTLAEADRAILSTIRTIGARGGLVGMPAEELHSIILTESKNSPQIASIVVINAAGILYASSLDPPYRTKTADVSDRDYFQHHRSNPHQGIFISRPLKSRIVDKWRFTVSRAVLSDSGDFQGLVAVAFDVDYFRNFYASLQMGETSRLLLTRTDGTILIQQPFDERSFFTDLSETLPFLSTLKHSTSGLFHLDVSAIDSSSRLVAYRSLDSFPAVAIVSLSADDILSPWKKNVTVGATITLLLSLSIICLTILLSRQILKLQTANLLVENMSDLVVKWDIEGHLSYVSPSYCRLLGKAQHELLGNPFMPPLPTDDFSDMPETPGLYTGTGPMEQRTFTVNGWRWIAWNHTPLKDAGVVVGAIGVGRDITEQKLAEKALSLSAAEWQRTFDAVNDAVWILDEERRIIRCNKASERMFKRSSAEMLGARCCEIVHSTASPIETCPVYEMKVSRKRETAEIESGGRFFSVSVDPIIDSSGLVSGALHIVSDITGQKAVEGERNLLESQLRQIQKMEAVGHLAGGIAHDFNNLLTPIIGYADLIRSTLPAEHPLLAKAGGIITAATKAKELTTQLLSFSRKQVLHMKPIDLNGVIGDFYHILRRTIRENIVIKFLPASEPITVKGDSAQIEQILLNLSINAQDAISGHGEITIETCTVTMDGENVRIHPGMLPGRYAMMTFSDNGCGIEESIIPHIFEPFFTTKPSHQGTGLGLATVYGIVKQHDGCIDVGSNDGGTAFSIYLPLCDQCPLTEQRVVPASAPLNGQAASILVVEDNDMVRDLLIEMLSVAGFTVRASGDPVQTARTAEGEEPVDLLIADLVMPGMNGNELYQALSARQPGLKVLFISGYPSDVPVHGSGGENIAYFLPKPFTQEVLVEHVNKILRLST